MIDQYARDALTVEAAVLWARVRELEARIDALSPVTAPVMSSPGAAATIAQWPEEPPDMAVPALV